LRIGGADRVVAEFAKPAATKFTGNIQAEAMPVARPDR
jgi:hypothetical protein